MKVMKSKLFKILVSIVLVVALLSASNVFFIAGAESVTDLEEEADRLDQIIKDNEALLNSIKGDISKQSEYVNAINVQLSAMNEKVSLLNSRVNSINSSISALNSQIESVNSQIAQTEADIKAANERVDEIYEQLSERLRAMYMSGDVPILSILLGSSDFSTFLVRSELLLRIAKHDDELLSEMIEELEKLEKEKEELAAKKEELNQKKQELTAQQDELLSAQSELNSEQSSVQAKYDEANNYLSTLDKNSAAYQQAIREAEAKKAAIEDKILELSQGGSSAGDGSESSVGSSLYCPVQESSRYISAKFGAYPWGGSHRGLDITCRGAMGKPIYAAESGTVTIASYQGDLGNYVLIDHGGGEKTGYAHNSSLVVSVGQHVERGQLIAYMGSTGYSFGPHCHFVLIKNGQYVNPEPYLPSMPYYP